MDLGIVSIFPSLFDYSFLAIGVLRVGFGLLLLSTGSRILARQQTTLVDLRALGVSASILGLVFIAGFYTQIAAILSAIFWGILAVHAPQKTESPANIRSLYVFVALTSLVFLFLG